MDAATGVTGFALRIIFTTLLYVFLWQYFLLVRRDLRAALAGGQAVLTVVDAPPEAADAGLSPGQTFTVSGGATFGRSPGNAIVLPDTLVSQAHARLVYRNGSWWVEDLGSTNGTFVNGKAVEDVVRIRNSDVLGCGPRVRLRLHEV